jgi:hypothetical protein
LHLQEDRVVEAEAGHERALGLQLHAAVGVRHAERRREGLHVHEGAELVSGGGVRGGGLRRGRGRGVAAVLVGEVHGGDVVDAGAALVLAAGGEPDEVLLRVAGHLRRRPRRHVLARDVPPVPPPVLLQPHQEQPESRNETKFAIFSGKNASGSIDPGTTVVLEGGGCGLLVLLLRPGDALLALLVRAARALEAVAAPEDAVAAVPVLEGEPGRGRRAAVVRERHEPGLDVADVVLEVVVVVHHVDDRLPGQHRRHLLPPVRRVAVDPRQRLLEQFVLLRRPLVPPPSETRVPVLPEAGRLPGEAGRRRRQQHLRPRLRHHLGRWLVARKARERSKRGRWKVA